MRWRWVWWAHRRPRSRTGVADSSWFRGPWGLPERPAEPASVGQSDRRTAAGGDPLYRERLFLYVGPDFGANFGGQAVRQRHIVQLRRHALAVLESPLEEL